MQPIDPNTLFSIFEQGDEQIYKEYGAEDVLKNPYVLMGMVMKGIENYHIMDTMYMRQYPEQYKNVRKMTKYKYLSKLYSYLERIDSTNFDSVYKIGDAFDLQDVIHSLNYLRIFFENIEQYEKCAVIKKYITLVESQSRLVLI